LVGNPGLILLGSQMLRHELAATGEQAGFRGF
jgi:hypothetical protein